MLKTVLSAKAAMHCAPALIYCEGDWDMRPEALEYGL